MRNVLARASVVFGIAGGLAVGGYTAVQHHEAAPVSPEVTSPGTARLAALHHRLAAQASDMEQALASMEAEQRRLEALGERLRAGAGLTLERPAGTG